MAKTFLEVFTKYTPDEVTANLLNASEIRGRRADVEKRMLEVDCAFSQIISKNILYRIEEEIAKAYDLRMMRINPKYNEELFYVDYIKEVLKEASRSASVSRGFFNEYEYSINGNDLIIDLDFTNGGIELLYSADTHKEIEKIIFNEFGLAFNVEIRRAEDATFDYELYLQKQNEELSYYINEMEAERARAIATPAPIEKEENKAPVYTVNTVDEEEPKLEKLDNGFLRVGNITVDISEPFYFMGDGEPFEIDPTPISALTSNMRNVCTIGRVVNFEAKATRKNDKQIISFGITDEQGSITVKAVLPNDEAEPLIKAISKTKYKEKRGTIKVELYSGVLCVIGNVKQDSFDGEFTLNFNNGCVIKEVKRTDDAPVKRVELHCHTNMSSMDATIPPGTLVELAASWGHKAIAVTDHGNVQGFPEAMLAADGLEKKGIDFKVIYGMEAYYVDDTARALYGECDSSLDDEFVVFDLETTGLSATYNKITEIGAVKIRNGEIIDEFNTFVDPETHIPEDITELTGITD
ncbi:MAG: PHP domain-containing protein, partial [Ruminococcaceae bacterium]|nr:PHP domain-containing protein [Oscillospiraceae bacterium]